MKGWLIVDKPSGISSAGVLNKLKRFVKPSKIGHAGTLDPFASGLLLIALGEATKLIDFAMNKEKSYDFTIKWGSSTDTIDFTGDVIGSSNFAPDLQSIEIALDSFGSENFISQIPPKFSAIHINGKRAYDLARAGKDFDIASREVFLRKVFFSSHREGEVDFSVECGKGFYVRSLARDIVEKLGCHGHVSSLRRTKLGKFLEKDAIKLDYLLELLHNAAEPESINTFLRPMDTVLDDILVLYVPDNEAMALSQGRKIRIDMVETEKDKVVVCNYNSRDIIAICSLFNSELIPRRVFNN